MSFILLPHMQNNRNLNINFLKGTRILGYISFINFQKISRYVKLFFFNLATES